MLLLAIHFPHKKSGGGVSPLVKGDRKKTFKSWIGMYCKYGFRENRYIDVKLSNVPLYVLSLSIKHTQTSPIIMKYMGFSI